MLKVVLVVESPVDVIGVDSALAVLLELTESFPVSLLLLLPSADDLLSGDFCLDPRAFLEFKIGHAEGVGGAGECIIFIFHKNNIRSSATEVKSFFIYFVA